jgi:dGTPase
VWENPEKIKYKLAQIFKEQKKNEIAFINRAHPLDPTQKINGEYLYDITAIINSLPFRRLKHKTQVFFAPRNDHICTRMEHVLHVSTISSIIARRLNEKAKINLDLDLVSAIALGHDLGHAPFGHLGETILTRLAKKERIRLGCGRDDHAFKHELYGRRMIDELARYNALDKSLNLTYAVREGIVCHCGEEFDQSIKPNFKIKDLKKVKDRAEDPSTLEASIVRFADKIAYIPRDIEDALRLSLISKDDIPKYAKDFFIIGEDEEDINTKITNKLIADLVDTSLLSGCIAQSPETYSTLKRLYDELNMEKIYKHPEIMRRSYFVEIVLKELYEELYYNHFLKLGFEHIIKLKTTRFKEKSRVLYYFGDYVDSMKNANKDGKLITFDYIAGMTDNFVLEGYEALFKKDMTEYIMF